MMGLKSCFRRFFPPLLPLLLLELTVLATCLALLIAAFLMLSLPFILWRGVEIIIVAIISPAMQLLDLVASRFAMAEQQRKKSSA